MDKSQNEESKDTQDTTPQEGQGPLGLEIFSYPSPFKGLSETEVIKLMKHVGEQAEEDFEALLPQLQSGLLKTDPVMMLASFSFYGLTTRLGYEPEDNLEASVLQHHVELLQAFSLQNPYKLYGWWQPAHYESLHELVRRLDDSFWQRRLSQLEETMSINDRRRMSILEAIRLDTQAIRNWGYPNQMVHIVTELFETLDDDIEEILNVRATNLFRMCQNMMTLVEDRMNMHTNQLLQVLAATSVNETFETYLSIFNDLEGTPEELIEAFEKIGGTTLEQARMIIIQHSDLRLPRIYTFTMDDLVNAYPGDVDVDALQKIVNSWSLEFGDLADENHEYFFMGNPVWQSPLIRMSKNEYYGPITSLLHTFSLSLMEGIIEPYTDLKERYEKRRATFLEDEIEELISRTLPSANVYRGSLWTDPATGKEYENDLLVIIDSIMLIIEAKSGQVSAPARRGAERRLARTIEDLQIAPSEQSSRFAEYLNNNKGILNLSTRAGTTNSINTNQVQIVLRLNCILEDLGILSYGWPSLKDAGFVPSDIDLVPTMSLMDLETVFEVLQSEGQILHYFLRRSEFEQTANYAGDEMDLLAFYLNNRFIIGDAEIGEPTLMLYGASETLRPHLMPETRARQPMPSPEYTDWWSAILSYVENRKKQGWTLISMMLRNILLESQVELEQIVKQKQADLSERIASTEDDKAYFVTVGPENKHKGIVLFVYKNMPRQIRNRWMQNLADTATSEFRMKEGLVIGIEATQDIFGQHPYGVIGYFSMSER